MNCNITFTKHLLITNCSTYFNAIKNHQTKPQLLQYFSTACVTVIIPLQRRGVWKEYFRPEKCKKETWFLPILPGHNSKYRRKGRAGSLPLSLWGITLIAGESSYGDTAVGRLTLDPWRGPESSASGKTEPVLTTANLALDWTPSNGPANELCSHVNYQVYKLPSRFPPWFFFFFNPHQKTLKQ